MKYILTTIITLFSLTAICQPTQPPKPITQDTLHLNLGVIQKVEAIQILSSCQLIYSMASQSETISAKQATTIESMQTYIVSAIYNKWPELKPQTTTK